MKIHFKFGNNMLSWKGYGWQWKSKIETDNNDDYITYLSVVGMNSSKHTEIVIQTYRTRMWYL